MLRHLSYWGKRFELITMPVNHYGEKVRFCLDLLGSLAVELVNLQYHVPSLAAVKAAAILYRACFAASIPTR